MRGRRAFAFVSACLACADAAGQEPAAGLAPTAEFSVAADSDGFHAARVRAGALYRYDNPWSYAGAVAESARFSQGGFRKDAEGVLWVYRDQRRDTLAGLDVRAGAVRVSGHLRPVGDMTLRLSTYLGTSVDFIASADVVEAPKALDRGIGHVFTAASVEHRFGDRLTVIGLGGLQGFSDGNVREHFRARLIWLALPAEGVTLQLRYREYRSRESDVAGAYFNPDRYRQWLVAAGIRRHQAGWVYGGTLGAGQETTTGVATRPSYLAEVRAEGPLAGEIRLMLHAGYYRSAGFIEAPGYASRLVGAQVVLPLH